MRKSRKMHQTKRGGKRVHTTGWWERVADSRWNVTVRKALSSEEKKVVGGNPVLYREERVGVGVAWIRGQLVW